jgi:hypothetical protein
MIFRSLDFRSVKDFGKWEKRGIKNKLIQEENEMDKEIKEKRKR